MLFSAGASGHSTWAEGRRAENRKDCGKTINLLKREIVGLGPEGLGDRHERPRSGRIEKDNRGVLIKESALQNPRARRDAATLG